jgi:hypothetical protein
MTYPYLGTPHSLGIPGEHEWLLPGNYLLTHTYPHCNLEYPECSSGLCLYGAGGRVVWATRIPPYESVMGLCPIREPAWYYPLYPGNIWT